MRAEIKSLHQRLKTTTVYVTHDQIEAMTMADRIVVMHDGIVEQVGTPWVVRPPGQPVRRRLHWLAGDERAAACSEGGGQRGRPRHVAGAGLAGGRMGRVHYGIRPGDLTLANAGIAAQVVVVEPTGAETELLLQIGPQQLTLVLHGRTAAQPGDTVHLAIDGAKAHVFDGQGCQRL
jgi:multiple sugar transport system ATP-binding protein